MLAASLPRYKFIFSKERIDKREKIELGIDEQKKLYFSFQQSLINFLGHFLQHGG